MSRDAVLAAAKLRFAAEGYEKTTLRAIASDAHVDASMVLYLFGSKADLFRESLRLILDPTCWWPRWRGRPTRSANAWCASI
ncbi:transcriptional regulator [Mycolicibacterium conceptionense]|uniref:Transcriptional regulator n=1 Tax=Mycolicibacterium conceptionense TaxID=451644 RepID=A0A0U1D921_9MYCO|nr:transcriptional regulator [Mycolicibacterium conceptionense]